MGYLYTHKTKGPTKKGLTATQVILLTHAVAGPIKMLQGDRLGTRCVGYSDETGAAMMVAYSNPELFLERRKLIRRRNEPHTYDITDAGLEAIGHHQVKDQAHV